MCNSRFRQTTCTAPSCTSTFADRRLGEAAACLDQGRSEDLRQALNGYAAQVESIGVLTGQDSRLSPDEQIVLARQLEVGLGQHKAQLDALLLRAPEVAQPALESTLRLSAAQRDWALKVLGSAGGAEPGSTPTPTPSVTRPVATATPTPEASTPPTPPPAPASHGPGEPTAVPTPPPWATAWPTGWPTPQSMADGLADSILVADRAAHTPIATQVANICATVQVADAAPIPKWPTAAPLPKLPTHEPPKPPVWKWSLPSH